jgi:hypothetical protein
MESRKMRMFQSNIRHDSRETESWHRFDYIVGVVQQKKNNGGWIIRYRREKKRDPKNMTDVCPAHWIFSKKNYDYK